MSIKPKASDHRADEDTREKLLKAAAEVFGEKGYDGATVKEIADLAGVNISLISYHFNGKEGVFRTILERFGRDRLQDVEKILADPVNEEDLRAKLSFWMNQFLQCHVDEKNVCAILHRENVMEHQFMWDVFEGTFLKTFEAVVRFIEAGKKKKIVRKDVDAVLAASFLYGSLIHVGENQDLQQKWMGTSIRDEKYRAHVAEQTLLILLQGITGGDK